METSVWWDWFYSVPVFGGMDGLALMSELVVSAETCRAQTPVYLSKPATVFLFPAGNEMEQKAIRITKERMKTRENLPVLKFLSDQPSTSRIGTKKTFRVGWRPTATQGGRI